MSQPHTPPTEYYTPGDAGRPIGSGLAIASMVCGIVSIVLFCAWYVAVPCAIVAIVLGVVARKRIRRGEAEGAGMATAGVACGSAGLAISALVIAATVIFLVKSRTWANATASSTAAGVQATAVRAAVTTQTANATARANLVTYTAALAKFEADNGRYPTSGEGLDALVAAPPGLPNWKRPYLAAIKPDPWNHAYVYRQPGAAGAAYDLLSAGPDGLEGGGDDLTVGNR